MGRAEERFEEQEDAIRQEAQERGRRRLPRLLRKAESIFSVRGYYPQDVKSLFDPVDFIIFDGMNRHKDVRRVVLFDGPAEGAAEADLTHRRSAYTGSPITAQGARTWASTSSSCARA